MMRGVEPAEFCRRCLEHFREEGLDFVTAWTRTLQSLPRGTNLSVVRQRREWVNILKWSRPAWQAAYEGTPYPAVAQPEPRIRAYELPQLHLVEAA